MYLILEYTDSQHFFAPSKQHAEAPTKLPSSYVERKGVYRCCCVLTQPGEISRHSTACQWLLFYCKTCFDTACPANLCPSLENTECLVVNADLVRLCEALHSRAQWAESGILTGLHGALLGSFGLKQPRLVAAIIAIKKCLPSSCSDPKNSGFSLKS